MREIQSLARGLQIIDALMNSQAPKSVTELANLLDVDKSTASRLVRTLENYGYVQRAKVSRAYMVGKRLHSIGWQLTNRYALRELAQPFLTQLVHKTDECSHIGVYSSGKILIVEDIQAEISSLRVVGGVGRLVPLHSTAIGKALLAFGDFPLPDTLPRFTSKSITDAEQFQAELRSICQQGYAVDNEENEYGVRCIASPVFDAFGIAVASIGISAPAARFQHSDVETVAQIVKDMAFQLSCELGYEDTELYSV
jgi:DNA-binding IclR family transcriptional regulator